MDFKIEVEIPHAKMQSITALVIDTFFETGYNPGRGTKIIIEQVRAAIEEIDFRPIIEAKMPSVAEVVTGTVMMQMVTSTVKKMVAEMKKSGEMDRIIGAALKGESK